MRNRRGFVLLIVIGLLAILLSAGVGFLSFTRDEVKAVAHVRDTIDASDMAFSALDWAVANIAKDLIDPVNNCFKKTAVVSATTDPNDPCYLWWYRPYEINRETLSYPKQYSQWIPLPRDYFPAPGVRGRFQVQILDANSVINLNDWLEDCNPTQCQMTHMLMGLLGEWDGERRRGAMSTPQMWTWNNSDPGWASQPHAPYRYYEMWRIATRTTRYDSYGLSPHWSTSNHMWMGLEGVENSCRNISGSEAGISFQQYGIAGLNRWCYTDPDTGRSPVNVNTCFRSREGLPVSEWGGAPCHVMEAVFNVESLRRIIKIGEFYDDSGNRLNAQTDALTDAQKVTVERLKTKLAYQYQETLCRYFTGSYTHGGACYQIRGYDKSHNNFYAPYSTTGFQTYMTCYTKILGGAEATRPQYACPVSDYSKTRFPYAVADFYNKVRDDLRILADKNLNDATNNKNPTVTKPYAGTNHDGQETVGVDKDGNFEVIPGKLDKRTASAVYDNIKPGKALLYPAEGNPAIRDPLTEMYNRRVGRDESAQFDGTLHDIDKVHGFIDRAYTHNQTYPPPTGTVSETFVDPPSGKDIAIQAANQNDPAEIRAGVPRRQLAFGPDWFSTELTTASTTFVMVITSQFYDANSPDPLNPIVLLTHQVQCTVELAPDIQVDDRGEDGSATGLHYYRDNLPRYFQTYSRSDQSPDPPGQSATTRYIRGQRDNNPLDASDLDSMDKNCATLPADTHSSVAKEWVDFRDVRPGEEKTFYTEPSLPAPPRTFNTPQQTLKRVIIRGYYDLNHGNDNN